MPNDTAPDVREVIKRTLYASHFRMTLEESADQWDRGVDPVAKDIAGSQADAVLTALAGLADTTFAAAVEDFGAAMYLHDKSAASHHATILALHAAAATRPVIDDAGLKRLHTGLWECGLTDSKLNESVAEDLHSIIESALGIDGKVPS